MEKATRKLFDLFKLVTAYVIKNAAVIVPNSPRLVLFGTRWTRTYQGNSRYVYEYILDGEYDIQPFWMTHDKGVYDELRAERKPVAYIYSQRGIYYLLRASAGVITHGRWDLAFHPKAVPESLPIVHSGHGNGVMHSRHHSPEEVKDAQEAVRDKCDYWITTSPFVRDIRLKRLSIDDDVEKAKRQVGINWVSTGYPRNDLVLNPPDERTKRWDSFVSGVDADTYLLYAPTIHYDTDGYLVAPEFFPFEDASLESLGNFLEENDVAVLIRPHPEDVNRMSDRFNESYRAMKDRLDALLSCSENILLATQEEIRDTTDLLPFIDILLTDYSSIYHHYLLLDRPILFVPYDYETYKEHRGFAYDYHEYMPGPEITSFDQFTEHVSAILAGDDPHEERRAVLRERIHKHTDGDSRKRVVDLILEILADTR